MSSERTSKSNRTRNFFLLIQLRGNINSNRKSKLHSNDTLVDSLQTRIQELHQKCEQYKEKEEENEDLSNLIVDYEEKISKLVEDNEKLADLIVEKNQKLQEIDTFMEEKNLVEDKIHDYELKLKELLESYDKLAAENESLREGNTLENFYKAEYTKMNIQCQNYKKEIDELRIKFNEYKDCVDSFEKAQGHMEKEREMKDIQLTKLQVNLNALEQENFLLKKDIGKLKVSGVHLSDSQNTEFEKGSYESQIKQLKEMNMNSKAEMQNLYELLRVRKSDSEEKAKSISKLQGQISSLTKDLSNSISINEELQSRLKRLSSEYEKITKRNANDSKENSISLEGKANAFVEQNKELA